MRGNKLPGTAPVIGALALSLALAGCDLLNNKPETDLERTMDAKIAYANATRFSVEVYYPESWGRIPQFGVLPSGSARQGFPFTYEWRDQPRLSRACGIGGTARKNRAGALRRQAQGRCGVSPAGN
jgi:hypothetical protein